MSKASPLYAAIDLGSNSFHMLIVRELSGSVQTIAKVKRKVRLAAGLDADDKLDQAAMVRGWQCLSLFAEQLQDIPDAQIKIVATATLRRATNAEEFLLQAEKILNHKIHIISGETEAKIIYRGVAHTSSGSGKRLVIDIGGASTELVVGEQSETLLLNSLDMGCVTWLKRFFQDQLSEANFVQAIAAAKQVIDPVLSDYRRLGWQSSLGASGTIQALLEIVTAQGLDERITYPKLKAIQQQVIDCGSVEKLEIQGLGDERKPVFASGLAIILALFESLQIESLTLAGGALREGLVYSLLSQKETSSVRARTAESFVKRHRIDNEHAERVAHCALNMAQQTSPSLSNRGLSLLKWAAMFHEVGLNIEFKKAPQHAAYIIDHSDLPGFTSAQKHFISSLLLNQRGEWQTGLLAQQNALENAEAIVLARLLRIAIIVCMRRTQGSVPKITLLQTQDNWQLCFPPTWNQQHPLRAAELQHEAKVQTEAGYPLGIIEALC
ncbi:guanosine-5'-triphosphate,3'-diphosphate diphosphatase [Agarivorans sp. MS3-6]|uniref:guanosine-5'-triphosphate,3'-diphosphate diphosphatase n=1 Tax=Agarivorans sp. TSD2052 TaxID=2937286 RepID=UPI00200F813B|nr:guanosine-5'-triphosphate,3'-diphosphate diphosphatase [Agarivorans sp. TSD2052]UPW18510.1 guanosine-5'-triphosphate,3'-diphosphate diphosphatase [Agarivorans sp. TSD2052]